MKTKVTVLALASLLAFALIAQQRNAPEPARSVEPDARILAKLSEIVAIRERLARNHEEMLAAGRASSDSLVEIELAEARIELARERGQRDAIISELQGLVAAHERRTKKISSFPKDRFPPAEIDRAQAALLEAQVRLLRAQK